MARTHLCSVSLTLQSIKNKKSFSFIEKPLCASLLGAGLIADRATCFASRLARCLTFPAAARFERSRKCTFADCFDVFHFLSPKTYCKSYALALYNFYFFSLFALLSENAPLFQRQQFSFFEHDGF